jgi:hypothetical protein
MSLPYAGQLGGTREYVIAPTSMSRMPSGAQLAGTPAKNTARHAKFNKSVVAETREHAGSGYKMHAGSGYKMHTGSGHEPEPEPEPLAPRARRGSMTLQEAMDDGLISKSEYERHMDKYLKDTFGVSSDKELAELKRQHRAARQQSGKQQSGKGKRHRALSRQMERRLAEHSNSHSAEHIQRMKADIQSGMTFKRAHARAMTSVGK